MANKHPINVEVEIKKDETVEHLIRRFLKKCKKENFMEEVKEHNSYLKPSDKERAKKKQRTFKIQQAKEKAETI